MIWTLLHPLATVEHLGMLPEIFKPGDPRPAKEQVQENYVHGGGYMEDGQTWNIIDGNLVWQDPSDPTYFETCLAVGSTELASGQTITLYSSAWVTITKQGEDMVVIRMD